MSAPHAVLIGNANVDIIMGPQQPWPQPGTEVLLSDYELRVGGQVGNAALALAALGVPRLVCANAGEDALGRWLRDSFSQAAAHWRLSPRPTTLSVGITHPDGERTFFTNRGHLEDYGLEDVLPHLPARAEEGSIALLTGLFLCPALAPRFTELAAALQAPGYRIALDTGWPPQSWAEPERAAFASWLPATDILLVNEAEACGFTGRAELPGAVAELRRVLPDDATLVVKRGPAGASAWRGADVASAVAPPVEVADSIGAGDIFNAGFLAAAMRGVPLAECLAAGVNFASAVIATKPREYRAGLVPVVL